MRKPTKAWVLWSYDPCPEGGFEIAGEFDTREEAEAAAKSLHDREEAKFHRMVAYCKEKGRNEWTRDTGCYGGNLITPGVVSSMEWSST